MKVQKLESTDAFVVFDLDDAPHSIGVVRQAPKILVDGATLLARSATYLFATFEQQAGGASAGINAKAEDRAAALAAFTTEVEPLVAEATLLLEPGKGVAESDLASLRAVDPRGAIDRSVAPALLTASTLAAADRVVPLGGARVLIDGVDAVPQLATELAAANAVVVGVSTAKGVVLHTDGLDVQALVDSVAAHGADAVQHLGEVHHGPALFATEADVVFAGSKAGVIDHGVAYTMQVRAVVPHAAVPVTAKALAVLRRAGAVVLPDFVTASGPMFAEFPEEGATAEETAAMVRELVLGVVDEVLGHEDGPLLGACYRAEAFLRTWQEALPFGRPLA